MDVTLGLTVLVSLAYDPKRITLNPIEQPHMRAAKAKSPSNPPPGSVESLKRQPADRYRKERRAPSADGGPNSAIADSPLPLGIPISFYEERVGPAQRVTRHNVYLTVSASRRNAR